MRPWLRRNLCILAIYALANVAYFAANPFASTWRYRNHDPVPIEVEQPGDRDLSTEEIIEILDEIDLVYGAREPTFGERVGQAVELGVGLVFFPATAALVGQEFLGYIGPPTDAQQFFTISVKERYNHLARLVLEKGYQGEDRFLVRIDASLSKIDGLHFDKAGADSTRVDGKATQFGR